MAKLSINVNKIATLRNARGDDYPNLCNFVKDIINFGAEGITIHPRPDERHILYRDAYEISDIVKNRKDIEFNIEGNPINDRFVNMILDICPDQVTLVPDPDDAITSNFGWDIEKNLSFLRKTIKVFKSKNIRTSIFIFPQREIIEQAVKIEVDRVEIFTKEYANKYSFDREDAIVKYLETALFARELGIGINAGHDLNLENIEFLAYKLKGVLDEVSIGHHLICESLYLGIENVINLYLKKIKNAKL